MKVIKLSTVIVAIFLTFLAEPAHALIDVPTLRFAFGESPLTFYGGRQDTNGAFPKSSNLKLGETATINPQFLWDVPDLRARIGIDFIADVGTKFGAIAIAGVGATAIFYPLGLSSVREVRDDFSEVVKTRVSPFIQFSITPTKFSVTEVPDQNNQLYKSPGSWPYFSANMIEISAGVGVDYPLGRDFVAFLGLYYRNASANSASVGNAGAGQIGYNGLSVLLGFMTNFY